MFLYRRALQQEASFFNLVVGSHASDYNALLSYVGRGITILERKYMMVTGFAAPDFAGEPDERGNYDIRVKDDAFYVYVRYEKTTTCPFINSHPADQFKRATTLPAGAKEVTETEFQDALASRPIDDLLEGEELPFDTDDHIVIQEPPPKPKKNGRGLTKAVNEAKDIVAMKKAPPKLNKHGVDVSGVPKFMLVGETTLDDITAVKRDRNGVKGISVGGKPKPLKAAPKAPPEPPAKPAAKTKKPQEAKKKAAKKPPAKKKG